MVQAILQTDDKWPFPQHIKAGYCYAKHASNALNSCLKKDLEISAHNLRYTFSDHLRAVECPMDVIIRSVDGDQWAVSGLAMESVIRLRNEGNSSRIVRYKLTG